MKAIDSISFEKLSPLVFEDLTLEILKTFNFENIQKESVKFDRGIDFMANLYEKDLFGRINKQTWLIESKFYQKERFSINILKELVDRYKYIFRDDAKLLLITNSLLTSVAREYLAEIHRSNLIDVRVIDGSELKDIITSNKSIHLKFFGNG
ncbi:hypothetical protein HDE68_003601 [Pedobacter cryoconitis]|uniref:Restriction endonuclease type IV Mrr domain-containing protein n=1 Tax=Pedobacter cryoconitis TaxID=188932 RepID=A0A7W8ZPA2_9SPHI|nr:restriction endonuclease [Pedobacter cryoconitis]MBB5637676.1 hypothetical protein [Pedobacter cryoconitis]